LDLEEVKRESFAWINAAQYEKIHRNSHLGKREGPWIGNDFFGGNTNGSCGYPVPCTNPVPYSPTDKIYNMDDSALSPYPRLFIISTFGLQDFTTYSVQRVLIQVQLSIVRNAVCSCEFGISVNGVVDESSVQGVTLDAYRPVSVTLTQSKLLPIFYSQDIALAYICTPSPDEAEVFFRGAPVLTVTLPSSAAQY